MKRTFCFLSVSLCMLASVSADVYVSVSDGNDSIGTGAINQPYKTIAKAMEMITAGDTCVIRAGVYRETISPAVDNITIKSYAGEAVVISGCDEIVGGWADASHNANIKTNTTDGRVLQVFIGEDRMHLARFPNEDGNMLNKGDMSGTVTLSGVNEGTGTAQVRFDTSANLPDDGDDTWVGGYYTGLNGTNVFTAAVGKITASSGRTLTCNDLSYYWRYNPTAVTQVGDGKGYIINHLRALDVASEWYSQDDGTFYFYPPSGVDLSITSVDVRTRLWGAELSNRSGIVLENLHFFASSVIMDGSQNCVMRECHVEYPAPWSDYYHKGIGDAYWGQDYGAKEDGSTGVYVSGNDNLVENCWIEKSWGSGIRLRGEDNIIQGSLVEDCGWMMRRQQPIQAFGTRAQILNNTVRLCSQSGIDGGNRTLGGYISSQLTVSHNIIEKPAMLLHDTGAFYVNHQGQSANGTVFAYNVVKDNTTNMPYGFYGDNGTDDMFVHHNLMVIPDAWIGIRFNGSRNQVFNNTVLYPDNAIIHQRSGHEGQLVQNNLGNKQIKNDGDYAVVSNNTTNAPNSQFMSQANGDYRIKSTYSNAVDGGVELSPYTDGFLGAAPDRGCYESGLPIWNAGSWVNAEITASVGTLLTEKPIDPIELEAAEGSTLADFSIVGGAMGVIPVQLNNVPTGVTPALSLDFNGSTSGLVGVAGTEMGDADFAYTISDNGDGTANYAFEIQRSTILLTETWRIQIKDYVDYAPTFDRDSLTGHVAIPGSVFTATVRATDLNFDDTLIYSKVSGSDWLTVASDGTLSGIPFDDDLGLNTFSISVEDSAGNTDTASLEVQVWDTATLLYQDRFTDGSLATNSDIGGGVGNYGTDNGDYWNETSDQLVYKSDGSGGNRACAYSLNAFDLSAGFRLEVNYTLESLAVSANNQFSFGLVADYTPSQNNVLMNTGSTTYGIGFNLSSGTSTAATGLLIHDEMGDNAAALNLVDAFTTEAGAHTLVLTMLPNESGGANWSYTYDGGSVVSGTIGAIDLANQSYQFVAHARDVTISKSLQEVRLMQLPDSESASNFTIWASAHGLMGADGVSTADTIDQDGLPNIIEAWFGTSPTVSDDGLYFVATDQLTTSFTHPQNENAPVDLSGSYEWSMNLQEWYACDGVDGPISGPVVLAAPSTLNGETTVTLTASEVLDYVFYRAVVELSE